MPRRRPALQSQFHRSQIGRAQRFIRMHLSASLSLAEIAREAGASSFHFVRLFLAYTGETPFGFLRRVRLMTAVRMLQEDPVGAITEIALAVGYETPSAFNKVFKQNLRMSPGEFRNLGKDAQYEFVYRLAKPLASEQEHMQLNMNREPEIVSRGAAHYLYLERTGPFAEVAPPAWEDLFRALSAGGIGHERFTELLGLSGMDRTRQGEESMIYQAGVAVASKPPDVPRGLRYRKLPAGQYAQFLLTGPYSQIWIAFNQIFRTLAESRTALRPEYCIENYINDPKVTPQDELKTQILIPI